MKCFGNAVQVQLCFVLFQVPRLQAAYGGTSILFRVFRGHVAFEGNYFFQSLYNYVTMDPDTSSVVASPSCLVQLLLAIFWAVFTGFSYLLVLASERGFLCLVKNLYFSSKQRRTSGSLRKTLLFGFGSSKGDNGFKNTLI